MIGSRCKIIGKRQIENSERRLEKSFPNSLNLCMLDKSCQRIRLFLEQMRHVVDCTEHALTEFVEVQKMESIRSLAQGLAHDLRNLLVVILANTLKIKKIAGSKQEVANSCQNIEQIGMRIESLLEKLAILGDASSTGNLPEIDLIAEIEACLKTYEISLPEKIELKYEPQADLLPVRLTLDELWRILTNLLSNAVEAIEGPGTIRLTVTRKRVDMEYCKLHGNAYPGMFATLRVEDTGKGIPPPIRSKIFDPMFTTKSQETSRGWGLSIVYSVVKNRGGWIDVVSECGVGTTIEVFIPIIAS